MLPSCISLFPCSENKPHWCPMAENGLSLPWSPKKNEHFLFPDTHPPTFPSCLLARIKSVENWLIQTGWDTLPTSAGSPEAQGPWAPERIPDPLPKEQGHWWARLELVYVDTDLIVPFFPLFIFEKHGGYSHSPEIQEHFLILLLTFAMA